jgi:hypothetical protein
MHDRPRATALDCTAAATFAAGGLYIRDHPRAPVGDQGAAPAGFAVGRRVKIALDTCG